MGKNKRMNRTTDMDRALFEIMETSIPKKDTGPEPEDILDGLFNEEMVVGASSREVANFTHELRALEVELEKTDWQRAEQIIQMIQQQTGEQVGLSDALRVALWACSMEKEKIVQAYRDMKRS